MKKILLAAIPLSVLLIGACTKEQKEEIKKPAKNSWFVNSNTYNAAAVILDTFNVLKAYELGKSSIALKFTKKPASDGDYIVRVKADEVGEVSIVVIDSVTKTVYTSMDNDGFAMPKDQSVKVTVNGGSVSVSFDEVWLKDMKTGDQAKVSANLN